MEKIELKQGQDKELTLSTLGLKLEIKPYWLIKEMINKNSQDILDSMIEREYRDALNKFDEWQKEVISSLPVGDEDAVDVSFVKYKRDTHVQQIQNVADISRNLLHLHSDWECILGDDEKEIVDRAFEYWKYNDFYGFKSTK